MHCKLLIMKESHIKKIVFIPKKDKINQKIWENVSKIAYIFIGFVKFVHFSLYAD